VSVHHAAWLCPVPGILQWNPLGGAVSSGHMTTLSRLCTGRPSRSGEMPPAQRLTGDLHPALRAELGEDAGDVGLDNPPGQEHVPAMSDVESPPAIKAAILTSAGVSASRPETMRGPCRPRTPRLMRGSEAGPRPAGYIPPGLQAVVEADGLVQGGPDLVLPARVRPARRPGPPEPQAVPLPDRASGNARQRRGGGRISFEESATAQAGRGCPGRASPGSGLRLAGLRRGLRHRHVVTGDHETTLQVIVDVVNPPVKGA
jgi:hypothetical protein